MSSPGFLIPLVVLVGIGCLAVVVISRWRGQQRSNGIQEWAALHSFEYAAVHWDAPGQYLSGPFGQGTNRVSRDVISGESNGYQCVLLNYQHTIESGADLVGHRVKTMHRDHVVILRLGVHLPRTFITTDSILTRVWDIFKHTGVDLESADFNHMYHVKSDDHTAAVGLLHARAMEYLIAHPHQNWWFENGDLLLADRGPLTPEDLSHLLRDITGFAALIPAYLLHQYGPNTHP